MVADIYNMVWVFFNEKQEWVLYEGIMIYSYTVACLIRGFVIMVVNMFINLSFVLMYLSFFFPPHFRGWVGGELGINF